MKEVVNDVERAVARMLLIVNLKEKEKNSRRKLLGRNVGFNVPSNTKY